MEKNLTAVMQIIERAKKYPSKEIRDYILSQIIKEEESIEIEKEQLKEAHGERRQHIGINEKGDLEICDITAGYYYEKTYGIGH